MIRADSSHLWKSAVDSAGWFLLPPSLSIGCTGRSARVQYRER